MKYSWRKLIILLAGTFVLGGYFTSAPIAIAQSTSEDSITPSVRAAPKSAQNGKKPGKNSKPVTVKLPMHVRDFLTVRGLELWQGNFEYNNIGVNIPDLFERFLNGNNAAGITSLKDAAKAGVRVVRCDGCTRSPQEFRRFLTGSGDWLGAFQRMLAAAEDLGISIVPVLLPDIRMIPTCLTSETGSNTNVSAYLSEGTAANRLALNYISTVVGKFKNDPRVLFWEIGEEYNLEADLPVSIGPRSESECFSSDEVRSFLVQMAACIRATDSNHLISTGNADMRPDSWHLRQEMLAHRSLPAKWDYKVGLLEFADKFSEYSDMITFYSPKGIDIVSVHQSPPGDALVGWLVEDDDHALRLPWSQQAASLVPADKAGATAGKPIFIGEFGQPFVSNGKTLPILWTTDFIRRIRFGPSSLCALYMWEAGNTNNRSASISQTPEFASLLSSANLAFLSADLAAPYNK